MLDELHPNWVTVLSMDEKKMIKAKMTVIHFVADTIAGR